MKFTAVRFSISVKVFGNENSVGMLCTYPNQTSLPVDSIEAVGQLLVIQRGEDVKAIPLSKMESGDPDMASLMEILTAPAGQLESQIAKRGPGRPTNASKALEAQGV